MKISEKSRMVESRHATRSPYICTIIDVFKESSRLRMPRIYIETARRKLLKYKTQLYIFTVNGVSSLKF